MKRILSFGLLAIFSSTVLVGCAEEYREHEQRDAARHEYKAERAAARGDYYRAQRERAAAAHEQQEANQVAPQYNNAPPSEYNAPSAPVPPSPAVPPTPPAPPLPPEPPLP